MSLMFLCGPNGCYARERDDALSERANALTEEWARQVERERFAATGERLQFPSVEEQAEYWCEACKAERRRMTIREWRDVNAAIALLKRHGYEVEPPADTGKET